MFSDLKIVTGSSNPDLAKAICNHLGCQLTPTLATTFSDGELRIEIGDNVRGDDVFVVQPTCPPTVNRNLVQLCLMLDALKRASAGRITAVIPYYGYARQDRKVSPRAPISAKMVADFISVSGAERVVTIDLHAGQIQGYFDCPVDNLFAVPVMLDALRQMHEDNVVIVSPDAGGVERARAYAKRLNAPLAIVDKRRDKPNQAQAMHVIGEVEGRVAIVVDDMIDTAGTLCAGADVLLKNGAARVYAVDVGYGQLAWKLRSDPRVVCLERTNARYLTHEQVPDELDFASVDVSFISLKLILPPLNGLLKDGGHAACLVKPQFEAGREKVGKKGVVRDPAVHLEVLEHFLDHAGDAGFTVLGLTYSPIRGPEGNIEYLGYLEKGPRQERTFDLKALVDESHQTLKEHGEGGNP